MGERGLRAHLRLMVAATLLTVCDGYYARVPGSMRRVRETTAFYSPSTFDLMSDARIHSDADTFFRQVDDDGDGFITFEELSAHLSEMGFQPSGIDHIFDLLDVNRDGEISQDEMRDSFVKFDDIAMRKALGLGETEADKVFNSIDANGDGSISKAELSAYLLDNGYEEETADSIFDVLDDDGDGQISREELHEGYTSYSALRTILGLPLIMQIGFPFAFGGE